MCMHVTCFLAASSLPLHPTLSSIIISLPLALLVTITIGTVATVGLCRSRLCAKQEARQEPVYDVAVCVKDRERIRISTNEAYEVLPKMEGNVAYEVLPKMEGNVAYEVLPKMEGNVAYGLTCQQSSDISSH